MNFEKKYLDLSESELILELDRIVFDDFTATPKSPEEVKGRLEAWLSSKKVELKEIICKNNSIKHLRTNEENLALVTAVFAALEASLFGSAASPLAVLLCKKGIDKLCDNQD
ncbi:hypothetical protein [Aquimarina macrocephali]|uniref:hypothetical protein n=1 Tax=Aquimarina macrocephali TaxID=666563 RepID=UPI003F661039